MRSITQVYAVNVSLACACNHIFHSRRFFLLMRLLVCHSVSAWVQLAYCWMGVVAVQVQDIHKLGVGIRGDAHKLQRDFGVQCNGLVCLSEEASMRLTKEQMPETRGLAGAALNFPVITVLQPP